jgi:hypothetical protein
MAQYAVEPELLAEYLPRGLEFDLFEGRCYVSLVAFLFDKVRVKGCGVPFHKSFEEVNLRFYVRRTEADDTQRRGVVFIREFVPRVAIASIAKRVYEEPYIAIPTRHSWTSSEQALAVEYGWKCGGRWHSLSATAFPEAQAIVSGSKEEFITEHYWGYTKRSDGSTSAYQVQHPRWETYRLQTYEIAADFGTLYGPNFAFLNEQMVASVLLAEGSRVSVYSGFRLAD